MIHSRPLIMSNAYHRFLVALPPLADRVVEGVAWQDRWHTGWARKIRGCNRLVLRGR